MPVSPTFVATPDQVAVDFLTGMPAVERSVWQELLPEIRALTFTIKLTQDTDTDIRKAEAMAVMQEAKAIIAGLPAGGDYKKAQKQIAAMLGPYFPTPAQASRRAELLVRHWAGMARNAAWYRTLDRQRQAYPYWKYVTFGDKRVRETHEALDKKIIPADSPFWDTHYPPWAPMCRCMVVPISQREYDQIQAKEKKVPMEQRQIVEGPQLEALEKSNTIMTARKYPQPDGSVRYGPPTPLPVAPEPGWTGWNPKDLRITESALKDRYKDQPEALKKMMAKADEVKIAPDITLGDHIRGLPDGKRLPKIPLPDDKAPKAQSPRPEDKAPGTAELHSAPVQPATVTQRPQTTPASADPSLQVSAHIDIQPDAGPVKDAAAHAGRITAQVHSDGGLPRTPLVISSDKADAGTMVASSTKDRLSVNPRDIDPVISVNPDDPHKINTCLHETGHLIDAAAIGFMDIVHHQDAHDARTVIIDHLLSLPHAEAIAAADIPLAEKLYLLTDVELFARAYAQYITTRSGDADAMAELMDILRSKKALWQWPLEQFAKILPLFDRLFRALGWIL